VQRPKGSIRWMLGFDRMVAIVHGRTLGLTSPKAARIARSYLSPQSA
jgi:hypothetical protein